MGIIKTEALILRVMDYLESSKLITCFTPDHGKVSLIARGARRVKSRIGGSLDLLQHVAILYYYKETREIQTLSQAEILHSFHSFQNDLQALSFALAVAELINRLEITRQPGPWLFHQTIATLHGLEHCRQPELLFYQFLWRWLEQAGYHPKLRHCLACGQPPRTQTLTFSIPAGGYYCANCKGEREENSMDISQKCLKLLLYIRENSVEKIADTRIIEDLMVELRKISWRFLRFHSHEIHDLKSLDFWQKMKR